MPTNESFPSFLTENTRQPQKGDRYAAFERGDSNQWQTKAAGEVWAPPEQRTGKLSGGPDATDRAVAGTLNSQPAEDPYQLIFRAGAKVRAEGMTESAESDYRAAIALADRLNGQAVLNAFQEKQGARSALEARLSAAQSMQADGVKLQQLHAAADKESYQLYRQYLAPATTRSNMGLAYIGTGDDRMIAKGEQLVLDAIKLRPELQFNAEFQRHLLEAYGVMESKRMAAGLPLQPIGMGPVDYNKPARSLAIPPQFNNHRESSFDNPYNHLDAAKASIRQNDTPKALNSFQKAIQSADRLSADAILQDRAEIFRHRMCLDRDMTRAQVRGANTQDMYRQRQELVNREWQLYQQFMAPATTRASMAFALIGSGNPESIVQGQKLIQDAVKLRPELEYTQDFRSNLQQAYREAYSRNPSARPQGTTNDGVPQLPGRRPEGTNPSNPRINPGQDNPIPGGNRPGTMPGGDLRPKLPTNPGEGRKQPGSDFLPPTEDPAPKKPDVPPTPTKPEVTDKQASDNPPSFLPLPPEHVPGQEPQDQIERDKLTDTLKWINSNPWALMLMTIAGFKLVKEGGKWLFKKRDGTEAKEGEKPTEEKPGTEDKTKPEERKPEEKANPEDKAKPEEKLSAEKEAELKSLKEELAKAEEKLREAKEASEADRTAMQKQIDELKGKVETAEKEKHQAQQKSADDRTSFEKQASELATKLQAAEQARQAAEQNAMQQRESLTRQVDDLKAKLDQAERDRLSAGEKSATDVKALDAQIKELKQQLEKTQADKTAQEQRAALDKTTADKELATIRKQLDTLQTEKQTSEENGGKERKALEQQIAELKETLKTKGLLEGQVAELEKKLADAEQKKTAADEKSSMERTNFEKQLKELNTKLEEAGHKSTNAEQAAAQEKQKLGQQIQDLQEKLNKVTGDATQASANAQKEAADLRQKLATAETARQSAESKAADAKVQSEQRIAAMSKTIEQAEQIQKAADEKAKQDKAQFDKQLATVQQELEAKRAELAEAIKSGDVKATQLDSRIKDLESRIATTKGESEKSQAQMKAAQEDLSKQMNELRQQLAKAEKDKATAEQNAARDKAAFDQQVGEVRTKLEQAEAKLKQQAAPNPASPEVTPPEAKAPTIADGHEVLPKIKMGQAIDNWKVAGVDGSDVIVKDQSENKGLSGKELQTFEADKFHKIEVQGESGALYRRNGTDKVYKMVGVLTPTGQPMKDGPQFLVLVDGIEVKTPRSPVYRGLTEGKATTEKPATEKPATEKPATEIPATEKPATEKPATEKPATEKPATEKPAGDKAVADKVFADKKRVLGDLAEAWKEMQGQKVSEGYSQDVATIFEQTEALKGDSWTKEQRAQFDAMKSEYDKQKSESAGKRPTIDFINGFLNNPAQEIGTDSNKSTEGSTRAPGTEKPLVTGEKQHSDQARSATETKRVVALETYVGPDGVRYAKPIPIGSLTVDWMEERIKVITPEDIENAKKAGKHSLAQELELHRNEYLKLTTAEERRSYAEFITKVYRTRAEAATASTEAPGAKGSRAETAGRAKSSGGLGVFSKTGLVSAGLVVLAVTVGDDSGPAIIDTSPPVTPTGR